jgi:predicted ATPase
MRIAISGTACQGKTTLLNDFLKTYTDYKTPEKTYRSIIQDDKHSKHTSVETQWKILDFMSEQLTQHHSGDNVIFGVQFVVL